MLPDVKSLGRWSSWWTALAPLVAPIVIVTGVLASDWPGVRHAVPREPYVEAHCTWSCHNHGCRHRARLPSALTSDRGLFGVTITALFRVGSWLSHDRGKGYGAANLSLFCVAWPGLMYVLAVKALRQRLALRAHRRERETGPFACR
jgi:hypothetical protein